MQTMAMEQEAKQGLEDSMRARGWEQAGAGRWFPPPTREAGQRRMPGNDRVRAELGQPVRRTRGGVWPKAKPRFAYRVATYPSGAIFWQGWVPTSNDFKDLSET